MKIHNTTLNIIVSLLSLSLTAAASAQLVPTHPAISETLLEKYDNPPAAPRKIETSPRMISQYGAFVSYQANVDANGNNILGDAANECVISVDPTNGNKMTIGWRQFNDVTSNFRQGGWGYTTDAGFTWHFPGILQNNVFRSDPVTKSDEVGQFFYLSLQSDVNESFFCDDLWRSTNGGQSWTELSPDRGGGGGDKQWFTIDKTNGPGHGFQYQADDGANCSGSGVEFQRSTNGGATWQSPVVIPNGPHYGTLDVDSNGNVYVGGWTGGTTFRCERSSNAQNGGQTPSFDRNTVVSLGGTIVQGGINGVGLCGQVFLALDHSGGATNNYIYMLASVEPSGRSTTDVMFSRSTDGGLTFSAPHRINDDGLTNKWHWFGTFAVAPNGRLDAVWNDSRNEANNTDSQLFYSYSTDAGVTWSPNVAVSNSFNPFEGYPNQSKIGDYITCVSDNTGANVAYSATFNFNPNRGQHEEDVYYVRVFPAVPTVTSAVSRKTHGGAGNFDVNLPLTGTPGIECRSTGGTNDYTMVVTFTGNVTVTGSPQAQVTLGTGCVGTGGVCSGNVSVSANVVTIPLTNIANAQTINVRLNGVNNAAATDAPATDITIPMSILIGDTNANSTVNAADVAQTKARLGQTVDATNFRSDINANGSINAADTAIVKQNSGTSLPP
jgi:hypothetical protein